jgi:uncharacterized damage-inducible protein DinB
MGLAQSMLPEFDHEMANTRKTLERIPEDKFDWKPHEKSTTLRGLGTHLSNLVSWAVHVIERDELDVAPVGGEPLRAKPVESVQEAVETFDKNVAAARAAIAGASDEHLMKPWTLLAGGKTIFTQPRVGVLRGMIMNHTIHHRAQLAVYLRLNDVPVPALYGPSADEGAM